MKRRVPPALPIVLLVACSPSAVSLQPGHVGDDGPVHLDRPARRAAGPACRDARDDEPPQPGPSA